jgi:hypothetical protein
MDPGTGLAILGSAAGGAKVVEKILGPTAEYVGAGLKNWTEHRVQNVARIFRKASERLGSGIDSPGAVPPKVLKEVLDEGSYSDDELTAEYFGGILASGRSPNGRDDRAASYLRLTSELSTYQIRFHYIAYTLFRHFFVGSSLRTTFAEDLAKMELFVPYRVLAAAMDFTSQEPGMDILLHCTSGLDRHDLISCSAWGRPEHLNEVAKKFHGDKWLGVTDAGMLVLPTQFGIDYYLWALGFGRVSRTQFLGPELSLPELPEVKIPKGTALSLKQ